MFPRRATSSSALLCIAGCPRDAASRYVTCGAISIQHATRSGPDHMSRRQIVGVASCCLWRHAEQIRTGAVRLHRWPSLLGSPPAQAAVSLTAPCNRAHLVRGARLCRRLKRTAKIHRPSSSIVVLGVCWRLPQGRMSRRSLSACLAPRAATRLETRASSVR